MKKKTPNIDFTKPASSECEFRALDPEYKKALKKVYSRIQPITLRMAPVHTSPGFTPPPQSELPGPSSVSGKPMKTSS